MESTADLDAEFFWEENKGKILAVLAIILVALIVSGIYRYSVAHTKAEAAAAFDAAKSKEELQAIVTKYPGTSVAGNARILLADKLRTEGKLDEALKALGDFTSQQPDHPLVADAWISYAATLEIKNDLAKASETYATIAAKYPASQAAPAALSAQARLAKAAGDNKKARDLYENLVQRFPASYWAQEAQQQIDRLPKPEAEKK